MNLSSFGSAIYEPVAHLYTQKTFFFITGFRKKCSMSRFYFGIINGCTYTFMLPHKLPGIPCATSTNIVQVYHARVRSWYAWMKPPMIHPAWLCFNDPSSYYYKVIWNLTLVRRSPGTWEIYSNPAPEAVLHAIQHQVPRIELYLYLMVNYRDRW